MQTILYVWTWFRISFSNLLFVRSMCMQRMESNGLPEKIHVSQDTANLLRQAGKGHWLCARKELVTAKGKGAMQTYFVTVRSCDGTTTSSSDPSTRTGGMSSAVSTVSTEPDANVILSSLSKTVLREGSQAKIIEPQARNENPV